MFRYQLGFNTVAKTWEALELAQKEYLLPMIDFAKRAEWYNKLEGKMVIPFAMDKGRVDYPLASEAAKAWHGVTTVGSNNWLHGESGKTLRWLVGHGFLGGGLTAGEEEAEVGVSTIVFGGVNTSNPDNHRTHWVDPQFTYAGESLVGKYFETEQARAAIERRAYAPAALPHDPCWRQTSVSKRPFIWYPHDVVVPVPVAFYFAEEANNISRVNLLFYGGSANSCTRKLVAEVSSKLWTGMSDVVVLQKSVARSVWARHMYASKFCLVPDGFSSISARLYEVLMHGCVPILISEAFHGAFEHTLDWRSFALFVKRRDVPEIPKLLREISDDDYKMMHGMIRRIHSYLHVESPDFWLALFAELHARVR